MQAPKVLGMDDAVNLEEVLGLLLGAPTGSYLLELSGQQRILWRISEGEPAEDALDPVELGLEMA